jgi:hypothetical protein
VMWCATTLTTSSPRQYPNPVPAPGELDLFIPRRLSCARLTLALALSPPQVA